MADLTRLKPGLRGEASITVDTAWTAPAMGSGSVAVLATPAMIALMERAAVQCVERLLPAGHVSLGTHIDVRHAAPTPPGARVTATAVLRAVDGRSLAFDVEARDGHETIGKGMHIRIVVDLDRFLARIVAKKGAGPA
jgi:predicted thioesterase